MHLDFPCVFEFGVIIQCGNSFFRTGKTVDVPFNFYLRMAVKVLVTRKTEIASHNFQKSRFDSRECLLCENYFSVRRKIFIRLSFSPSAIESVL